MEELRPEEAFLLGSCSVTKVVGMKVSQAFCYVHGEVESASAFSSRALNDILNSVHLSVTVKERGLTNTVSVTQIHCHLMCLMSALKI